MYKIVEKRLLAEGVCLFKIIAPQIALKRKPGQFVVLRVNEHGERIPLTIADSDTSRGTITIICQSIGKSTKSLNSLNEGDSLQDVLGPLGIPTRIEKVGTIVTIGGGVGIAEAWPISKAFKEQGNYLISISGFRSKNLVILENEIKEISDEYYVTTDDGSHGRKGLVIDVLNELIANNHKIDHVLAIGPVVMMEACANITKKYGIKTEVSLNAIMVDATGMCGACRVTINGQRKFVCVDGPEFDAHGVDFKEIKLRQKTYSKEEKESLEIFCNTHHKT